MPVELAIRSLTPSQVHPDDARRVADRIVNSSGYRRTRGSVLDRMWRWLEDLLAGWLPEGSAAPEGGVAPWWSLLILLTALAAAMWALWRFRPRSVRLRLPRPRRRPPAADVATEPTPLPTARSRRRLLALAQQAEAEGRWGDSVTLRFRALVLGLAEREVLPDDPAATTGQLRAVLRGDGAFRARFAEATRCFEEIRYGGAPAGPDDPRRLQELDERLVGGSR